MTSPHADEEPAEHRRFARCPQALAAVAETDEADLVAAVLRDQDAKMADSTVGRHLDHRAADLPTEHGRSRRVRNAATRRRRHRDQPN